MEAAKRLLETYFLEDLFRVAQGLIVDLRRYAREITTAKGLDARIFRHLDEPYASYLKGVMAKEANRIELFVPEKMGTAEEFRPFRRLEEIDRVRRILSEIAYLAPLIQKAFGTPPLWLAEIALKKTNLLEPGDLKWSTLVLTALANWLTRQEFRFEALPVELWPEFLRRIFTKLPGQERNVVRESVRRELLENFKALASQLGPPEEDHLQSFLNFCLFKAEEEFAFAEPENPPDPRYVQALLIELTPHGKSA